MGSNYREACRNGNNHISQIGQSLSAKQGGPIERLKLFFIVILYWVAKWDKITKYRVNKTCFRMKALAVYKFIHSCQARAKAHHSLSLSLRNIQHEDTSSSKRLLLAAIRKKRSKYSRCEAFYREPFFAGTAHAWSDREDNSACSWSCCCSC